jgi:electron transport complex protein RnfB
MVTAKEIDACLPQTQCGECGYPGCMPYAQALASKQAPIDRCPPGGTKTLTELGALLNIDPTPYLSNKSLNTRAPARAIIREPECIGCTKCIQACPVDAILGSATQMHTILSHECTGCGLCIDPCPVDCIELIPEDKASYDKDLARHRFEAKQIRALRDEHDKARAYRDKRQLSTQINETDKQAKQAYVLEALARSQTKNKK